MERKWIIGMVNSSLSLVGGTLGCVFLQSKEVLFFTSLGFAIFGFLGFLTSLRMLTGDWENFSGALCFIVFSPVLIPVYLAALIVSFFFWIIYVSFYFFLTWHCSSLSYCEFISFCAEAANFKKKVVQEDSQEDSRQNVPIELQTQNVIPLTPRVTTQTQIVVTQPQQNTQIETTTRTETLREVVVQEAVREVTRAAIQQVGIPT